MRRPRISVTAVATLFALLFHCALLANAVRTKHQLFTPLGGSACIRRLNATHSTGCSSAFGGSLGVLHLIETADDFAFVARAPPYPPYVLIVPAALFTAPLIRPLLANRNVSGILLLAGADQPPPAHFSGERRCPNQYSSYNNETCDAPSTPADRIWHPYGSGLLYDAFPFPVHLLTAAEDVRAVLDCHRRFNQLPDSARPLCSAEIDAFMAAGGDARRCLRRSSSSGLLIDAPICDALSGYNVYATLFPRPAIDAPAVEPAGNDSLSELLAGDNASEVVPADDEQFIVVTARLDTVSMFDGVAPGAMEVLPLVVLSSVAHTLRLMLPERLSAGQPNVLFVALQGEAFDYIGSGRLAFDMQRGRFPPPAQRRRPIELRNVQLIVDLADLNVPNRLVAYRVADVPLAEQLLLAMRQNNDAFALNVTLPDGTVQPSLPPSAAHAFLRQNGRSPVLVLRSPDDNPYLHSVYDDGRNLRYAYANTSAEYDRLELLEHRGGNAATAFAGDSLQMAVRNVSTVLAKSLYRVITGRPHQSELGANAVLVDELLHCYLQRTSCPLLRAVLPSGTQLVEDAPAPNRYVGVNRYAVDVPTRMALELFSLLLGRLAPGRRTQAECAVKPWIWMPGRNGTGECRETTRNLSTAESPAFWQNDYDMRSGEFSTWTESRWKDVQVRLFLKPSATHEALTLAIGFVVTMFSLVGVFLVNSRSDVLFEQASETPHPERARADRQVVVPAMSRPAADGGGATANMANV